MVCTLLRCFKNKNDSFSLMLCTRRNAAAVKEEIIVASMPTRLKGKGALRDSQHKFLRVLESDMDD